MTLTSLLMDAKARAIAQLNAQLADAGLGQVDDAGLEHSKFVLCEDQSIFAMVEAHDRVGTASVAKPLREVLRQQAGPARDPELSRLQRLAQREQAGRRTRRAQGRLRLIR